MALEPLLARTSDKLKGRGIGIRRVIIWTCTWLSEYWEQCVNFKEPVIDTKSILSRLKQVMESFPQPGPVEQIGLKITGVGSYIARQGSILADVRSKDHLLGSVRQLEFRLGGPQLFKIKEVEPWSRIPERRYSLRPLSR
jgi:DNA polymerase-4/protein ImuB